MARFFLDTSALIKLYKVEPNSAQVRALLSKSDVVVVSQTVRLEFRTAFANLTRMKLITPADANAFVAAYLAGRYEYEEVWTTGEIILRAENLIAAHAVSEGLRPLDTIQLASALIANKVAPLDAIITTDNTLAKLAALHGLNVLP